MNNYRNNGYDYKDYSKETYRDNNKARETGDLKHADGHNSYKGGELEIRFALDLARAYLKVTSQGRVLDVGCGSGYMTKC